MTVKVPCHIVDTQQETDTEMFWDGYIRLDDQNLHVEMHGRSGMGRLHTMDVRKFDVPFNAILDIEWKDRVVGSLLEISFHDSRYADLFPGTREDQIVELSIREIEEELAESLVRSVKSSAANGTSGDRE